MVNEIRKYSRYQGYQVFRIENPGGLQQPPFGGPVTKNTSEGRGLMNRLKEQAEIVYHCIANKHIMVVSE